MSSGVNLGSPSEVVRKINNYTKTAHKTLTDFTNEMSEILRQSIERIDNICFKVRGYDLDKFDCLKEKEEVEILYPTKSEPQITQADTTIPDPDDPSYAMELLYVLRNERELTKKERTVKKKPNTKREPALLTIHSRPSSGSRARPLQISGSQMRRKLEKSLERKLRQRHLESLQKSRTGKLAEGGFGETLRPDGTASTPRKIPHKKSI